MTMNRWLYWALTVGLAACSGTAIFAILEGAESVPRLIAAAGWGAFTCRWLVHIDRPDRVMKELR